MARATNTSTAHPPAPWPDDWFEPASACLWCAGTALEPRIDGVEDTYFGAVPGRFAFARCRDCGALVLTRRPAPERLGLAYRDYYTHAPAAAAPEAPQGWRQRIGRPLLAARARTRFAGSTAPADLALAALARLFPSRCAEVDALHRHLPPAPARVLDYGCGNGAFLALARALGHEVVGVDVDPGALAQARARGLAVFDPGQLPGEGPPFGPFAHISLVHVLEHVAEPVALLARLRGWLLPGGALFAELPNADAAGLARHGRFWRGLEAPRHFSLPSRTALERALREAGYRVERIGQRAFAAGFMDREAQAARRRHPGLPAGPLHGPEPAGPEFLTVLARPR